MNLHSNILKIYVEQHIQISSTQYKDCDII